MRLGIFTKPEHVEKIVNYLNQYTSVIYVISTNKQEIDLFEYDIGISYCWPWKVSKEHLALRDWYNYHPGLLPECKGVDCYVRAMLDGKYGVTLHRMDEGFDTGEILRRVQIPADPVNTQDLANITHYELFRLFQATIADIAERTLDMSEESE